MSNFKSGIIFIDECVIAQSYNDSHTDLLKPFGIENTEENEGMYFVKAELVPPDNAWWTDPATWKFNITQKKLPKWFKNNLNKYETMFREKVSNWAKSHIMTNQVIDSLSKGYYLLDNCTIKHLSGNANVLIHDTIVYIMDQEAIAKVTGASILHRVCGKSSISTIDDVSFIEELRDQALVQIMRGHSKIGKMMGYSVVCGMFAATIVRSMRQHATIYEMHGNSIVCDMSGMPVVERMFEKSVVKRLRANSSILYMANKSHIDIMADNATVIKMDDDAACNHVYASLNIRLL